MIVGILLAAGESRRFGSRKVLHPLPDGTPMALRSARNLAGGVDRVLAVIAPGDAALLSLFAASHIHVHECAQSRDGMGATLACGVRASADADGWVIALADMPFILPATIAAVAQALRDGAPLAAPLADGRRGHPVAFGREYYAELSALTGDIGAREIVSRDRTRIVLIGVNDPGIHRDIDTPRDLESQ